MLIIPTVDEQINALTPSTNNTSITESAQLQQTPTPIVIETKIINTNTTSSNGLIQMFNKNIDNEGISEQKLRYLSTLLMIKDKLKKHPELTDITYMDTTHLKEHILPKLRKLAHCIGITQPHTVPSKEQLIQRIVCTYESIKKQDVYEEQGDMVHIV